MTLGTEDTISPEAEAQDGLAAGVMFGPYRIVRLLGKGGMGAVYEATHTLLKKKVALKTLHPGAAQDGLARQRFIREGQAASKLDHPHVVSVSDVGVQDGIPYLVMELMAGEDLGDLLEREKVLSIERTVEIMVPVCVAVEAAHRVGIIHRDLKPDNIFLAKNALGQIVPKVLDFGISKIMDTPADQGLTSSAALMGTAVYMAPEQAMGAKNVDARSDQYTLGAILYECVTGKRAFSGESLYPILRAITEGEFDTPRTVRPEVPTNFEALILRAMSVPPSKRYASAEALAQELLAFGDLKTRLSWESNLGVPANAPTDIPPGRASQLSSPFAARPDTVRDSATEIDNPDPERKTARRTSLMTVAGAAALTLALAAGTWAARAYNANASHATASPGVVATQASVTAPTLAAPTPAPAGAPSSDPVAALPPPPAAPLVSPDASVTEVPAQVSRSGAHPRRHQDHPPADRGMPAAGQWRIRLYRALNPHNATCPWSGFEPANLTFCEADRCAWITQPANTWSNVGFLIVGLIILRLVHKQGWTAAGLFGPIAIVTSVTSSLLHGTGTFFGQAADQIGMFLESALFVTLNLARWRGWSAPRLIAFYLVLTIASTGLLLRFRTLGVALFTAHIVAFAGIELRLLLRDRNTIDYRPLAWVVGLFVLSYGLWWLDKLRIVCDPGNHIFTLHSAWHLLGAASFYFWFKFFVQFRGVGRGQIVLSPSQLLVRD